MGIIYNRDLIREFAISYIIRYRTPAESFREISSSLWKVKLIFAWRAVDPESGGLWPALPFGSLW